tara:strand:- start:118 stop:1032 length:915 start_codon:yes stop_codon:yes gene_type:complete
MNLQHAQLVELLAAAASRDSITLAATEAALMLEESQTPWETLPETAIARVATILSKEGLGSQALAWCAVCQHFRHAQPPVRELRVGFVRVPVLSMIDFPRLFHEQPDEFALTITINGGCGAAHRIVEEVPPRYAAEVTHLAVIAVLADPSVPLLVDTTRPHGARFTALRELYIRHRSMSWLEADPIEWSDPNRVRWSSLNNTLARCASALIINTAPTLKSLTLYCPLMFSVDDVINLLPVIGPSLTHFRADLAPVGDPWRPLRPMRVVGRSEDTRRLQQAVAQHCPAIPAQEVESSIICHKLAR